MSKKQLPPDKPGIIIIDCEGILFRNKIEEYFDLARQIDQTIFEYPNLMGGVIVGPLDELEKITKNGNYTVLVREEHGFRKAYLIIKNPYSDFKSLCDKLEILFK